MRFTVNYSSVSQSIYYAVGRESGDNFDGFKNGIHNLPNLSRSIESEDDDHIMFRINRDNDTLQKELIATYKLAAGKEGEIV